MGDEHLSLHSSAAAAPAAWTPRPPQLLAGPAAALACHHPPRQPAHWDHMMAVLTPQMIYYMTEIKVSKQGPTEVSTKSSCWGLFLS